MSDTTGRIAAPKAEFPFPLSRQAERRGNGGTKLLGLIALVRSAALSARARQLTPQARERGRLDAPARRSGAQRAGGGRRPVAATARTAQPCAIAPAPDTNRWIFSGESRGRGGSGTPHGHDPRRWRRGLGRTVKLAIARHKRTALRLRCPPAPPSPRARWLSTRPSGDVGRAARRGPGAGRRHELACRADDRRSAPPRLALCAAHLRSAGPAAAPLSRSGRPRPLSTPAHTRPPAPRRESAAFVPSAPARPRI